MASEITGQMQESLGNPYDDVVVRFRLEQASGAIVDREVTSTITQRIYARAGLNEWQLQDKSTLDSNTVGFTAEQFDDDWPSETKGYSHKLTLGGLDFGPAGRYLIEWRITGVNGEVWSIWRRHDTRDLPAQR